MQNIFLNNIHSASPCEPGQSETSHKKSVSLDENEG